jgi:hypothetical protein
MDTNETTPTPAAQPDAAPVINTPAPANLSALVQPGASIVTGQPAPNLQTAAQGSMSEAVANETQAYKNASDLSKPTPPPAPVPHARLLAMVSGLATGLGAAATSLATGGREGGAKEVQQEQAAAQQQKIQAQQAVEAQKNAKIQQQITIGNTNHQLAQSYLNLMTLPDEITKSHLSVSGEQQRQDITGADFQATHGGMTPEQFTAALSGTTPASSQSGAGSFFTTNAQQQLEAATKILGSTDPYIQKLQTVLGDAKATPKDLWTATTQLQSQIGLQEKATQAQNAVTAGLPKNQQEAAAQLAAAQNSGDPARIAHAQSVKDSIDPLRIPAVMPKEYEVEVSSEYGAAGIVPPRTRKSGQRVKLS